MKITRQNYEHWFIDFVEGVLTPEDEAMVRKFAQSNPDLNNELEDIQMFKLVPEPISFSNKNLLKQNQLNAISGITKFEQLCVAHLENELNEKEQHELEILLNSSEKRKNEFELMQKIKLSADKRIAYSSKNMLKKLFVVNKKTTNFKVLVRIAAVFILLIGLTFLFKQNRKTKIAGKQFAENYRAHEFKKVLKNTEPTIAKFTEQAEIVLTQNKTEKNELIQTQVLAKKIASIGCESVNYNKSERLILFTERINQNAYVLDNKSERQKIGVGKIVFYKMKFAGKSLGAEIAKLFKNEFKYKKTFTDDGRMLIAFKAGDFEYKINKKQKKSATKNSEFQLQP